MVLMSAVVDDSCFIFEDLGYDLESRWLWVNSHTVFHPSMGMSSQWDKYILR